MQFLTRLFAWLLGEAPEGQRKFVFAARLELMFFAGEIVNLVTQAPEQAATNTETIVGAMVTTALIAIGGNAWEWGSKAFQAKRTGP
jgi:hypothetical protein